MLRKKREVAFRHTESAHYQLNVKYSQFDSCISVLEMRPEGELAQNVLRLKMIVGSKGENY